MILRNFQEGGDFTWRVSDCEELVGLLTGDGRVIFQECWFYLKFWVGEKDQVQTAVFRDYD